MNDIEKLFKEKLAQHPVAPPPVVWEKLEQAQVQKKKKGAWWWMAASVIILLLAGIALLFNQPSSSLNDTLAIELPRVQPETLDVLTNEIPKPLLEHLPQPVEPVSVAEVPSSVTVASPIPATQQSEVEVTQRPVNIAKVKATRLEEPQPQLNQLPPNTLLADASDKTAVTIIYKSGNAKEDKEIAKELKKPLRKAFAFLADIKEGGVGFSELRSAKSEIISKAFSNKRDPMAAE